MRVARGRSREAEGGVPPRVLRDYCRKTLTPQPLAESPPCSGRARCPGLRMVMRGRNGVKLSVKDAGSCAISAVQTL